MNARIGAFALTVGLAADPLCAQWMFRGGPAHPGTTEAAPRHAPRVKSGTSTGRLPFCTDEMLNGPGALQAAASYTSMSGTSPSRRHWTIR